jgi:hypothetical protein
MLKQKTNLISSHLIYSFFLFLWYILLIRAIISLNRKIVFLQQENTRLTQELNNHYILLQVDESCSNQLKGAGRMVINLLPNE